MYVIGIVGFIGSGKNTAGDFLVKNNGFVRDSFAKPLKDIVAILFSWPRHLLEGDTVESRQWREEVDLFWSKRLGIPNLTPRWVLQYFGTEVFRRSFHEDIWIASLERRLQNQNENVVITDVRFINEMMAIKNIGGHIIRVQRGQEPDWIADAAKANTGIKESQEYLDQLKIHVSEYSWIGGPIDYTIINNNSLENLQQEINTALSILQP